MIVITGASRGIGEFLIENFRNQGEICLGIRKSVPAEAKSRIDIDVVDISNPKAVDKWVSIHKEHLSRIVLVNCAGINYTAFAHKADIDEWKRVIDVNLFGSFNMARALLPIMRFERWGRIINFSSVVAQMGVLGSSAYAASKSALWGLTKSLASENGAMGITVNALNLGYFKIGMIEEVSSQVQDEVLAKIPCKKFGDPTNIANAIRFLAASDYVNGALIDINGGLF